VVKTALYLRVSTDRQTTESQAVELRDYCVRRGWKNVVEYVDKTSGAKFTRSGLDTLVRDVRHISEIARQLALPYSSAHKVVSAAR
jgi:DNA invertase Pin-like site-specific DNA recombinase